MPRRRRIHFPGAFYHVILRGNKRKRIFRSSPDYRHFLRRLKDVKKRLGLRIHAYILMPNHVHFLVEVGEQPLGRALSSVGTSYAQYFNKKYHRVGHLFQGRYRAILCERDSYLLELVRYIHLNPVRAGLVHHPTQWFWSSYHTYVGKKNDGITDVQQVLTIFGTTSQNAVEAYKQFVDSGLTMGHKKEFYGVKDGLILGSDDFIKKMKERYKPFFSIVPPAHTVKRPSLDNILSETAASVNLRPDDILHPGKWRNIVEARTLFVKIAFENHRYSASQIADFLKCSPPAVSKMLKKIQKRQEVAKS